MNPTDMGLGVHSSDKGAPRWSDCPLYPRVRELETNMVAAQHDIKSLQDDVEPVVELGKAVSSLNTHIKISWGLTVILITAIIVGAVGIWYNGGLP